MIRIFKWKSFTSELRRPRLLGIKWRALKGIAILKLVKIAYKRGRGTERIAKYTNEII